MLLMTVPNTDTPRRQNKPNAIEAVQFGHAERYFEILYEGNVAMSVLGSKLGSVCCLDAFCQLSTNSA
jgi:hypothetical protein